MEQSRDIRDGKDKPNPNFAGEQQNARVPLGFEGMNFEQTREPYQDSLELYSGQVSSSNNNNRRK